MLKPIFFILVLVLTSCQVKNKAAQEDTEETYEVSIVMDTPVPDKIPYTVYTQTKKYDLSLYEPEEGRYAGAYILSDDLSEINDFEAVAGEHAVYLYDIKVGDTFPMSWLLSCMSNQKTPYIVINPQNDYDPFNMDVLSELADEIGRFYVPVFVDLYPNASLRLYDPEEYKAFFMEAYKLFKSRASNAAIVFSAEQPAEAFLFYPGDNYTDWVGINIQMGTSDSVEDIFKNIDNLYYRFHKERPILISSFALSHISGENYVYRTEEAAGRLRSFYDQIIQRYPRMKGVNYININYIEEKSIYSNQKWDNDNYLVTDEKLILDTYKNAVSGSGFISAIDYQSHMDNSSEYFSSPFPAYLYENDMYISSNTIIYDLNLKGFSSYADEKAILDGEVYYKLKLLEKNRLKDIRTDERERAVYLDEP